MAESEFKLDLSEFEKLFKRATVQLVPEAAERGLGAAGLQLEADTVKYAPTVPQKESTLRGSASVFVQNKLIQESVGAIKGSKPGQHATDHSEPLKKDEMVAVIGFNSPYAAYQHEGRRQDGSHVVKQYSDAEGSQPGPKFLETPLSDNREQYMGRVAHEIKKTLGN